MESKRSVNLCSIYVLPLLGLNKHKDFGYPTKFVNSYVSEDNEYIVVECTQPFSTVITNQHTYKLGFTRDGSYFAVFGVPTPYKEDIRRFREGKYSKFSDAAKEMIRKKSGLQYKEPVGGGKYRSAKELLVLDKDKAVKEYLEEILSNKGSKVKLDDDAELASIPGEDNFFNLRLSNKLEETI